MGNDGTESGSNVPYGRLAEARSTAEFIETQQNHEGGIESSREIRADLPANSYQNGMGGGEPEGTSAEHEQLFADYRDDEEPKGTTPEADTEQQMDRSKRNGSNGHTNNRGSTLSGPLLLVNILVNVLMFAVAGFITYHCFNKAMVLFSWHPTFMSIGYLILMSQAVLTMSGASFFTHRCQHRTKVFLHWLLQAIAGVLITIASVCIFLNKVRLGKSHFQTLHGIFGLVTVCFTLASIGGGVTTKYAFQLRYYMRPIYSKIVHGIAGTVSYLLAVATIGLGVYSHWFQEDNDANVRLALVVAIGTIALYVVTVPMINTVRRIKTAVRTTL